MPRWSWLISRSAIRPALRGRASQSIVWQRQPSFNSWAHFYRLSWVSMEGLYASKMFYFWSVLHLCVSRHDLDRVTLVSWWHAQSWESWFWRGQNHHSSPPSCSRQSNFRCPTTLNFRIVAGLHQIDAWATMARSPCCQGHWRRRTVEVHYLSRRNGRLRWLCPLLAV